MPANGWRAVMRPGDWVAVGLGGVICLLSFPLAWRAGAPETAVVRASGTVYAELDLARNRTLEVPGPLGKTVVRVERRRVRVVSDPGPRQYCVRQGWLSRPGEIAICAPNQVSVQVQGRGGYDSLSY